jgi:ligand-binding sensor domain-containing protein
MFNKIRITRKWALAFVAVGLAVAGGFVFFIVRLNSLVGQEKLQQEAASRVDVSETRLRAPATDGLTIYLNASEVRATAVLAGVRYLATSGGLVQLDAAGEVKRRYTTLDGLPDNDLTALAVFQGRLFIGTATGGLVAFDGTAFTGYSFVKPKAAEVRALAATETRLLIGTFDGGLFEYDGARFSRRLNSATGADFKRLTALLPYGSRVYIGTQDLGLYIWREAHIDHIGVSDGLPSPHVTGFAALGGRLSNLGDVAVATDFGVVALGETGEIKPISNMPNITSLAVSEGRLWAGLFTGGVAELQQDSPVSADGPIGQSARRERREAEPDPRNLPALTPVAVCTGEGKLWALTGQGAFCRDEGAPGPSFQRVAASLTGGAILTSGHITSLAIDGKGRLWVGYFDRGIDILVLETNERLSRLEDDRVREINFLRYDQGRNEMLAATSRGLAVFDDRERQTILTRDRDGLINDSIAHVSLAEVPAAVTGGPVAAVARPEQAMVLATAGGLTEISGGKSRSINAFHGLASNHLYCTATAGSRLFVGSLAGLVEIEALRVTRVYKTSNSQLSHDWVTALCEAGGTLYIGTNGGGVDALLPTGEWINYSDEVGRFEVNQNAMHLDGERLYVGTSQRGLLSYNTRGRRWTRFTSGLPSQNITAIASDDRFIYAGTLNGMMRIEKRVIDTR